MEEREKIRREDLAEQIKIAQGYGEKNKGKKQ